MTATACIVLSACGSRPYSTVFNLDFEYAGDNKLPAQWEMPDTPYHGYAASLDYGQKQHATASLRMEQTDPEKSGWAIFCQVLPATLVAGRDVALSGWIRTRDVTDGFADLFLAENEKVDYNEYPRDEHDRGVRNSTEWTRISIRKRIGEHASGVEIGGILKGPGSAWFDNLELTIDGKPFRDTLVAAPKTRLTREDKRELRKYVYPLRTFDPKEENSSDLNVLNRLIGESSVVALGENSHGSSEIYKMKERLIRYMAENMGFDIFSMEAYMPGAYQLNLFTQQGKSSPEKLIHDMGMWIWNTEEMLSLVNWMKAYNGPEHKITFTGFDMQSADKSVEYLELTFKNDTQASLLVGSIREAVKKVLSYTSIGSLQCDPVIAARIEHDLTQIEGRIEGLSYDGTVKEWLRQNVTLLRQFAGQGPLIWRDRCMADNLLWIKRQNPSSRIVIWAHNGHIEKDRRKMGGILQESMGRDYVNFGFTFHNGQYTALRRGQRELVHPAQQPYPGTLEYLLGKLGEPMFILDLKKMREQKSPVLQWIDELWFRHVGVVKIDNEFTDRGVTDKFDYLIFIRKTTPSQLLYNQ